nr:elongation factor 1-gamma [Quercus suber]
MVHIQQWIDFAPFEIDANILAFYRPKIGCAVYLPLTKEAATSLLKRELGAVNTRLASNTSMVGHSVLLADIVTPC